MEDLVKLLIVDDDEAIRRFFAEIFPEADEGRLEPQRYVVDCVADGEEAARRVADASYDVVVTDLCMPKMDGIRLIREIQKLAPATTVVAITGFGTIKDAVSLMKTGAFDVLTKPFSLDEIRLTIDKAVRHHRLARKNRELEHRLKVTEKLAVIGKLAAGVAHEINNPLDAAIRFVNLSLGQLAAASTVRGYLLDARAGLERIAGIVHSLLDFSRSIMIEAEPLPLGDLLREAVVQVSHRSAADRIRTTIDLEDEAVAVPGGYLHVFVNLVKNALDEMPEGGDLLLQSRHTGDAVEVAIADSGPGIPEAIRTRIFEPFFTTKKVGAGTGLGLSICQQLVEKQGGRITFTSERGVGTTFTVHIPLEGAGAPETLTVRKVGPDRRRSGKGATEPSPPLTVDR